MDEPAAGSALNGVLEPGSIVVRCFARTDVGRLREHNEDEFLVADLTRCVRTLAPDVQRHLLGPRGSLFVVCDGMGGAAAGEVASRTAVQTIFERLAHGDPPRTDDELVGRLDLAIIEAGQRIYEMAKQELERRGMGTTCTAAAVMNRRVFIHQVGDSRCYVLRGGRLVQLTRDQSLLTQLIEAGQVKAEDASKFEHSNIILQALGTAEMVNTDVTYLDLCRGDTLLLCSDGLSSMVDDDTIRSLLEANPEPLLACRALTEAANQNGGEDNITVIVARFEGPGLPEPTPDDQPRFQRYPKPRPPNFDRVPYTISEQPFADGGPAMPMSPEVPMGPVPVGGVMGGQAAAGSSTGVAKARSDSPASDLAEALRSAAEAPHVLEWSEEDLTLSDLPAETPNQPPSDSPRRSAPPAALPDRRATDPRAWGIVAVLLIVLIVLLLVFDSIRRDREGHDDTGSVTVDDVVPVPPPSSLEEPTTAPAVLEPEPTVPGPKRLQLRHDIDPLGVQRHHPLARPPAYFLRQHPDPGRPLVPLTPPAPPPLPDALP